MSFTYSMPSRNENTPMGRYRPTSDQDTPPHTSLNVETLRNADSFGNGAEVYLVSQLELHMIPHSLKISIKPDERGE